MAMKSILFVVTSAGTIGPRQRKTGYEYSEVAHPYLIFLAHGYDVEFASPSGGTPPADGFDVHDNASVLFSVSRGFRDLNQSHRLADVDLKRYAAVFFPGGLGPMVDLARDSMAKTVIASAYEMGRVVGAVCHGPVALLGVELTDGTNLLEGRQATSFTTAEEEGHSQDDVPFMLDEALIQEGVRYTCNEPFVAHVVVDGRLVTGQNPASAAGVATAMISVLEQERV